MNNLMLVVPLSKAWSDEARAAAAEARKANTGTMGQERTQHDAEHAAYVAAFPRGAPFSPQFMEKTPRKKRR